MEVKASTQNFFTKNCYKKISVVLLLVLLITALALTISIIILTQVNNDKASSNFFSIENKKVIVILICNISVG
jgi:hypothetical protein